jgi:threonine aldolase
VAEEINLEQRSYLDNVRPVKSNILIFDVKAPWTADRFLIALKEKGILASAFGPQTVRFVLHLGVEAEMVDRVVEGLEY